MVIAIQSAVEGPFTFLRWLQHLKRYSGKTGRHRFFQNESELVAIENEFKNGSLNPLILCQHVHGGSILSYCNAKRILPNGDWHAHNMPTTFPNPVPHGKMKAPVNVLHGQIKVPINAPHGLMKDTMNVATGHPVHGSAMLFTG